MTLFTQPDLSLQDMMNSGITPSTSSFREKEYYKTLPQIQEAFKTESGAFDDNRFNTYYTEALKLYGDAASTEYLTHAYAAFDYDPIDYFAPIGANRRQHEVSLVRIMNPERRSRSIESMGVSSAPTMSAREVAQDNFVFNYETGKFEDWTPNDWGGLKALTRPTLVLATWDEDGDVEIDGRIIHHNKGDLKYHAENGDPFYETLGNRDPYGKEICHITDTLTRDGSYWNRYDIFDHDGLDKSITGILMETLFKVGPMFIPGVGKWYGAGTAAIELNKLIPLLIKSIGGAVGMDMTNSSFGRALTNYQTWFQRFDSSLSDYAQSGFFNLENIGQLITDSSMQLFQQRFIGEIPLLLNKLKMAPLTDNTIKWGRALSLAYMAGTSSMESYEAFKAAGASDQTAGLGMLATMGAMWKLMNKDYFRDFWYEGSYLASRPFKEVIQGSAKQVAEKTGFKTTTKVTAKTIQENANWVRKTQDKLYKAFSKIKPGGIVSGALNEGLEETMEEISMDGIKALFAGLNALGLIDGDRELDFGITPEDMASRYFTSFIGGGIGGAVFSLHNRFDRNNNKALARVISQNDKLGEMVYLFREGKERQLRTELGRLHKNGLLGSTSLSGVDYELVQEDDKVNLVYKEAKQGKSQNDILYKQLNDYMDRISNIIKEEGFDISDDQLLQMMTFNEELKDKSKEEVRYLLSQGYKSKYWEGIETNILKKEFHTELFQDWNKLTEELVRTKSEMEAMLIPEADESADDKHLEARIERIKGSSEYKKLATKLEEIRAKRDEILSGKRNDYYVSQLLYTAKPAIAKSFVPGFGIHNFARVMTGKEYSELDDAEKAEVDKSYKEFSTQEEKSAVIASHDLFWKLNIGLAKDVLEVANKAKSTESPFLHGLNQLTRQEFDLSKRLNELEAKRDELLKSGVASDNEELINLNNSIQRVTDNLNALYDIKAIGLMPALSESGEKILTRPAETDKSIASLAKYAESYIKFLEHIQSNGLYLDNIDGDLHTILNAYVAINNLSLDQYWVNQISGILGDYDSLEDRHRLLASKLQKVVAELKAANYEEALEILNNLSSDEDLVNNFDPDKFTEDELNNLLSDIIPTIGNLELQNFLKNVSDYKKNIQTSPAYELINKAANSLEFENVDILQLLTSIKGDLINSEQIKDFLIKDPKVRTKLKEVYNFINAIKSIIDASLDYGTNYIINKYRTPFGKEELAEIERPAGLRMLNDLEFIQNQIDYLLRLHKLNSEQKLGEQKVLHNKMRLKFANKLLDGKIKSIFTEKFGINIDDAIQELDLPKKVYTNNDEEFKALESKILKLETFIYTAIKDLEWSDSDIAETLVSSFDINELIKQKSSEISYDNDKFITDYDTLIYLTSIIATPSQNFYSKIKAIINKSKYKKALIYGQEHAVKIGHAFISNPELFRNLLNKLTEASQKHDHYFIKARTQFNGFSIFGGAGVGKTEAVMRLLSTLFPNAPILCCAPTKTQYLKLQNAVNDKKAKTKAELISLILGRQLNENDYEKIENEENSSHDYILKKDIEARNTTLFGNADKKILVIDEISWFTRPELELISKWATKNDVIVIVAGDYMQNGAFVQTTNKDGKAEYLENGINDLWSIRSLELSAPMRPENIAKLDNYNKIKTLLHDVYQKFFDNPTITSTVINQAATDALNRHKLLFDYFETDDSFGGEKFIKSREVETVIKKLQSLNGKIAIITNNKADYKYAESDTIKIFNPIEVQGEEFDYVLIDVDFSKNFVGEKAGDFDKLKNLYTLIQRSKKGSFIVRRSLSEQFDSKLNPNSSGKYEMSEDQIEKFNKWRADMLSQVPDELIDAKEDSFEDSLYDNEPNEEETNYEEEYEDDKENDDDEDTESGSEGESESEPGTEEVIDESEENKKKKPQRKRTTKSKKAISTSSSERADISGSVSESASNISGEINGKVRVKCWGVHFNRFLSDKNGFDKWLSNKDNRGINVFLEELGKPTGNPEIIKYISAWIRAFYLNGYYKENEQTRKNIINRAKSDTHFATIDQNVRPKNNKNNWLLTKLFVSNPEFKIVKYGDRGLLVATVTVDGNEYNIPLLITEPRIGEYKNDIVFTDNTYKSYKGDQRFTVDSDFTKSGLNENKHIFVYGANGEFIPVVFSCDPKLSSNFTEKQRLWIFGDGTKENPSHNGRTYLLFSSDPFITKQDINEIFDESTIEKEETIGEAGESQKLLTYTINKNPKLSLIGVNWKLTTFQEVVNECKKFSKDSEVSPTKKVLNADRAGQLAAVAYNLGGSIRTKTLAGLQKIFEGKNGDKYAFVVYYGKNKKKLYNSYEDLKAALKNNTPTKIKWVEQSTGKRYTDHVYGEHMINYIVSRMTSKEIELINKKCQNLKWFKQGIYAHDELVGPLKNTQFWGTTDPQGKIYETDLAEFYGANYELFFDEYEEISEESKEENQLINSLNEQLKSFGIKDRVISSIDTIESVLETINSEVRKQVRKPEEYVFYKYDPETQSIEQFKAKDIKSLITNLTRITGNFETNLEEKLNNNYRKDWKFIPFSLSLSNDSQTKVLINTENGWEIKDYSSELYNSYYDLYNSCNARLSGNVSQYVNKLLNNQEVTPKESRNYIKGLQSKNGEIQNQYKQLVERVNNFLINKLTNGEC